MNHKPSTVEQEDLRVVAISGAGSGIGRAVAIRLADCGWIVALLGRRSNLLEEVSVACGPASSIHPTDVGDAEAVSRTFAHIQDLHGRIDALVISAGMNIVDRSWRKLTPADFRRVLNANLEGAFNCVNAALPGLRLNGGGTVVGINSEAGRIATSKAGAAYVASKFGLRGLLQSINTEERGTGIRAVSIFPGDVNTPLLDRRSTPPPASEREFMLQPEDVAACVQLALELPNRAIVEELVIRPA